MQVKATERDHKHLSFCAQGIASAYQLRDHFELIAQCICCWKRGLQLHRRQALRNFGLGGDTAFHHGVVFILQHMFARLLQHGRKGIFDFSLVKKIATQITHRDGAAGAALVLQRRVSCQKHAIAAQ